ncbi:MAG: hypothetical protein Fur002_14990 [Anaerolineales bacterium]
MKPLSPDDKLAPVMIYTQNMLIHGDLLAKESVRVSILLRTQGVPNYLHVYKAHVVTFGGTPPKSYSLPEMFVATPSVIAFHLAPPAQDAVDYDATEANRVMQPLDVMIGSFFCKGHIRVAGQTEISVNLEVMRTSWLSIYDSQITNPFLPQFNLQVPMMVVSPTQVHFAVE